MDCLTFRRQRLEDPGRQDHELAAHQAHCPACATFARTLAEDEARLREAMSFEPPAGLADRIHLAISMEQVPARPQRRWLAVAASGLLAVGAATFVWQHLTHPYEDLSLERSVLHHVADEVAHLHEPGPARAADIDRAFATFGAQVDTHDIGRVNFADVCAMRGGNGVHLVLQGEHGPVTVFFMPGETASDMLTLKSQRFAGVIEPTTWGSIAVVGEQGEALMPVLDKVRRAVKWPAANLSGLPRLDASPYA